MLQRWPTFGEVTLSLREVRFAGIRPEHNLPVSIKARNGHDPRPAPIAIGCRGCAATAGRANLSGQCDGLQDSVERQHHDFALYPRTTEKLELKSILILEPSEPKPTFESLLRVEIVMPACRTHCGRESFPQIALHQLPG
jgi:hypothetical protein